MIFLYISWKAASKEFGRGGGSFVLGTYQGCLVYASHSLFKNSSTFSVYLSSFFLKNTFQAKLFLNLNNSWCKLNPSGGLNNGGVGAKEGEFVAKFIRFSGTVTLSITIGLKFLGS